MPQPANTPTQARVVSPLSIERMRLRRYDSEPLIIKQIDTPVGNFYSFLVSYRSDGLKVFARINVPVGNVPSQGFPVVVFAHGHSPNPLDLNYFQRPYYETWTNAYAQAGFLTVMPGYRGHGVIDGKEAQGKEYVDWFAGLHLASPFYAIDVLNLVAGLSTLTTWHWERFEVHLNSPNIIDDKNLFLAAHSLGGDVALKILTVTDIFRAASIWAGVTASLRQVADFYSRYDFPETATKQQLEAAIQKNWEKINAVASAMPFVDIDTTNGFFYLDNMKTPLLLHQGTGDYAVDPQWSVALHEKLQKLGKDCTLNLYENNDHELSLDDGHRTAIERDVEFFKNHLRKEI